MKRRYSKNRTHVQNTIVSGHGANTTVDRGASQTTALTSLSPYYTNDFLLRYRIYANLYETSWEARKIIDIPVDDAMREKTIREGLSPDDEKRIADAWEELGVERQLRRCLKQERLLGGSVLLAIMLLQKGERLDQPLNDANIMPGDLKALNVIDVVKLSRSRIRFDPFAVDYDKVTDLNIDGITVDASRMVVFDGNALFGRNSQRLVQNFRYNPLGFGESKLAPLYDALLRAIGTQQAAYQLVNVASSFIMTVENLRNIKAIDGNKEELLKETMRQLSIYNSALIDGKDIKIDALSANFGSVPELLHTYIGILAAGSDIPQARFMGDTSSGLANTGTGDARNYYDMIDGIIANSRRPAEYKILNWIGASLFGYKEWKIKSKDLKLSYPPLWNLDAVQQATRDETVVRTIVDLYRSELITREAAVNELNSREIFDTQLEAERALDTGIPLERSGLFDSPAEV